MSFKRITTKQVEVKRMDPRISSHLKRENPFLELYDDEEIIEQFEIEGIHIDDHQEAMTLTRLYIKSAIVRNSDFRHVNWHYLDLTDVIFEGCDFSNANLREAMMSRVVFKACKFVGTQLPEATLTDVLMEDSTLQYANFSHSRIKQCEFNSLQMQQTDFGNCKLGPFEIKNAFCEAADFIGTPMKGIDLSTNTLINIRITAQDLKGAYVSAMQWVDLASQFEVNIKET